MRFDVPVLAWHSLMMTTLCSRNYLNRTLCRALIVGGLSSVGLLCGVVPSLSSGNSVSIVFSSSAYAQSSVSDAEVAAFAAIVKEFEPTRGRLMEEIYRIVGSKDIPDIVCGIPKTINSLPGNAQSLAKQLCSKYDALLQKYKMSPARFQDIANRVGGRPPADSGLKKRVEEALLKS